MMKNINNYCFLKSYGDHLQQGNYKFHSRFKKVINFISDDSLVSIVKEDVGAGPLNIVVSGIDIDAIHSLIIKEKYFILNHVQYDFLPSKRFDSTIKPMKLNLNKLKYNLTVFEKSLLENSQPKSLAFLIDKKRKKNFKTTFEKKFINRFECAVEQIYSSKYIDGIKRIKGTGFGLTPSGDDFVCGFLHGLNITQHFLQTKAINLINEIYKTAKGENPISNAFLLCAKQGMMFEKFKELILSVLYLGKRQIDENTKGLCRIGGTSGSDMGIGFLKAFSISCSGLN